jgi:hypothetical protein
VGETLWLLNVGTLVTKIKVSGLWHICDVSVGKLFSSSLTFWEIAFIQVSLNFLERRLESPE